MTPASGLKNRTRWMLYLAPLAIALPAIFGFAAYYQREQEALVGSVNAELEAIAEGKVTQIANWRRERTGDGRVEAASSTMETLRRILRAGRADAADRERFSAVTGELEKQFLYTGAFLIRKDGRVVAAYPADRRAPARFAEFAGAEASAQDVRLEDLFLDGETGRPTMALTTPVEGLGALILEIDPARFLYPLLEDWPGKTETGEMLLARRGATDILYLSNLRHRPAAALRLQRNVGLTIAPEAALDQGWKVRGKDYRGTMVLAVARHVPDAPWYVVAKVDEKEAMQPVRRLEWLMGVGLGLIAFASAAFFGLLERARELQLEKERETWFQAIANETPAYLWMALEGEPAAFLNEPLNRYLGAAVSPTWADVAKYVHPEDLLRARRQFLRRLAVRGEYAAEFRLRRFDGTYRWVENRGRPRFGSKGEYLGYAGSVDEIDGRVLAERQLRASNTALERELKVRKQREWEIQSLSARLMKAQEEERGRLARELHDDLSQRMAALSMAASNLSRRIPAESAEIREELGRLQNRLGDAAEAIRRMSHELHPAILEHAGLGPALHSYCEEFGELTGVKTVVETEDDLECLSPAVTLGLYRVAQEALQNVAKHARTERAWVTLRRVAGAVRLTIRDAGVGLPEPGCRNGGLGLMSMQERARLFGGTVEIEGAPGQGTTVVAEAPCWDGEPGAQA